MPKPTRTQVRQDKVLTNLSVGYQNEAYISDQILPGINVGRERTGVYYVMDMSKFRRVKRDTRAPGVEANLVEYGLTTATYGPIIEKSLAQKVPVEVIDEADSILDPLRSATKNVTERLFIGKDYRLSAWMQDTGNITQNTTLSGTDQWSDYTNSDPIDDVKTAKATVHASIIKDPNTLVMGKQVWDKLVDHPDILERIKYVREAVVAEDIVARIFGVDKIIVGKAAYNTADEGQTDSLSYLWGKNAWLVYINPAKRLTKEQISFGYHFRMGAGRVVDRWYSKPKKSWYVRVSENYEQKIVAASAAYLIKDAVA